MCFRELFGFLDFKIVVVKFKIHRRRKVPEWIWVRLTGRALLQSPFT